MNLRRRERESKVPVALWVASGPSRPEGGTKAERAAEETACERSEAGGQVLSPQPNEENSTERVLFFRLNMNEKDLNLRRREREAKVPVALWAASGPSRPEDERRQRGRRRRQPASGVKQAVKSFPLRPQQ